MPFLVSIVVILAIVWFAFISPRMASTSESTPGSETQPSAAETLTAPVKEARRVAEDVRKSREELP